MAGETPARKKNNLKAMWKYLYRNNGFFFSEHFTLVKLLEVSQFCHGSLRCLIHCRWRKWVITPAAIKGGFHNVVSRKTCCDCLCSRDVSAVPTLHFIYAIAAVLLCSILITYHLFSVNHFVIYKMFSAAAITHFAHGVFK